MLMSFLQRLKICHADDLDSQAEKTWPCRDLNYQIVGLKEEGWWGAWGKVTCA